MNQNVSSATNSGNTRVAPADAQDLDQLWVDNKMGDGITGTSYHTVPVGRPRDFFART
jgi:hypothetical protein